MRQHWGSRRRVRSHLLGNAAGGRSGEKGEISMDRMDIPRREFLTRASAIGAAGLLGVPCTSGHGDS